MRKYTKTKWGLLAALAIGLTVTAFKNKAPREKNEIESTRETVPSHEGHGTETTLTPEQMSAAGVTTGNMERKELTATLKANGQLMVPNTNKASASTLYSGVVKSLLVQVGDHVSRGQVVATVSNPEFVERQKDLLAIKGKLAMAEQELKRQKTLRESDAGTGRNLQQALAELRVLRAERAALEKQVRLMGIAPATLTNANMRTTLVVRAPISGTVSNVYATVGSYIDPSKPVMDMVDNSSLHLDLQIFERDLPKVRIGQTVHFTITNNPVDEYDATVYSIGSSFSGQSKTVAVHCRVKGNKQGLIDGMNVTGIVSLTRATTPAVPTTAVVEDSGRDYVFVVKGAASTNSGKRGATTFKKVQVIRGTTEAGYCAVTPVADLPANARIATRGAYFINAKLVNAGEHDH
ncbi:efflux RND transporter periplasmic adaptor subunit [Hallella colorans]|uniref:efflux RND transporter periplasmic adaptor subunit n=1 Tax=Hallella colorans TaxID=1703337 RepID=UPI0023F0FBC8|nr:efflux RND transporter periplasmic adaptor subunit [Hallella colorans]